MHQACIRTVKMQRTRLASTIQHEDAAGMRPHFMIDTETRRKRRFFDFAITHIPTRAGRSHRKLSRDCA